MNREHEAIEILLALAQRAFDPVQSARVELLRAVQTLETRLAAAADERLVATADAAEIDAGTELASTAVELSLAGQALATARAWRGRDGDAALSARVVAVQLGIAQRALLAALRPLSRAEAPLLPAPAAVAEPPAAGPLPAASHDGLRNIASFHREHERYYTAEGVATAADLFREANRLRIVADVWMRPSGAGTAVESAPPGYEAAGCVDLNEPLTVAAIGVLFMEGEAEPAELRMIQAKMRAFAIGWAGAGKWVADKMRAAWLREQALFTPALIELARPRYNTIANNWRGAGAISLAGRLLGLAGERLSRIDFRPVAVRADRAGAGRKLRDTAGLLALAGQLRARGAAELAENDRDWTEYLEGLAQSLP
jgi:hypothetical protein